MTRTQIGIFNDTTWLPARVLEGDRVRISFPWGGRPLILHKEGGKWILKGRERTLAREKIIKEWTRIASVTQISPTKGEKHAMPQYVYAIRGGKGFRFTTGSWDKFLAILTDSKDKGGVTPEVLETAFAKSRPTPIGEVLGDVELLTSASAEALREGSTWDEALKVTEAQDQIEEETDTEPKGQGEDGNAAPEAAEEPAEEEDPPIREEPLGQRLEREARVNARPSEPNAIRRAW